MTATEPIISDRSTAAQQLDAAASRGRLLSLQYCQQCDIWLYPPRDACHHCLATALTWTAPPANGTLLAETWLYASHNPQLRGDTPIRIGTVRLDIGVSILCHIGADCQRGGRVHLYLGLDQHGRALIHAEPESHQAISS